MTLEPQLRFARYIVSGGSAAIVDLLTFMALVAIGEPIFRAAMASFLVAAVCNYLLSAFFAFRARPTLKNFIGFFLFASIGMSFNTFFTWVFYEYIVASPPLSKIFGIGIAFFFNFFMNHFIVFRNANTSSRRA